MPTEPNELDSQALARWKQPEEVKEAQAANLRERFAKYLNAEQRPKNHDGKAAPNYWKWLALCLLVLLVLTRWKR